MRKFKHVRRVPGFENNYLVTRDGKIISLKDKQPRTLQPCTSNKGYAQVKLYRNGKQTNMLVHRAVAVAFIPNPENKPQVNHINGDKTDNRVENLEWCTHDENIRHAFDTGLAYNPPQKLTANDVQHIRQAAQDGAVLTYLAEDYGVSRPTVSNIVHGKIWRELL